jgi:hypothetical protein
LGQDTAVRVLQPRFYGNSEEKMKAGFREFHQTLHCDFMVAGRTVRLAFHRILFCVAVLRGRPS